MKPRIPLDSIWIHFNQLTLNARGQTATAFIALICLGAAPDQAAAEPPMLRPAQAPLAGGGLLDPGDYAIPCASDWNGDGKKDLIVGYRYADKVALYLNSGTDDQPVFTGFTNLQTGDVDIYQQGTGCGAPAPWVCDYDCDGKRDLLVGNGTDGKVYFYRNLNTDAQPVLAPGAILTDVQGALSVGTRATPFVHDWNEDGLDDLLVGSGDGYVYLYRNVGAAQSPAYTNRVELKAGSGNLNLGPRSVVRILDWDGDGLKDLVGSSSTGVYWCRNLGNNTEPVLAAAVALRSPVSGRGNVAINTGARMRLDLVDWNNDGVMDILLGNVDGSVFLYEGYHFAISGLAPHPDGAWVLQWHSASYLKYHVLAGANPAALRTCATNLPSGGNGTCWTNNAPDAVKFFRVLMAP